MRIKGSIISFDGFQFIDWTPKDSYSPFRFLLTAIEASSRRGFAEELLAGKPTPSSIFSPELDTFLMI